MSVSELRIPETLYAVVKEDLARPHAYAGERVGFLVGRTVKTQTSAVLVLLHDYWAVADEHYIEDELVGARIGSDAISAAMKRCANGRLALDGIFHVHLHEHFGPTGMSRTDQKGIPPMIHGFAAMNRDAVHGIIILSKDHGRAWLWRDKSMSGTAADKLVVVGSPISALEEGRAW